MTHRKAAAAILAELDDATASLVRLSGAIAGGTEPQLRKAIARCVAVAPPEWAEEALLQSYLFAGFPRALNAMREWRKASGRKAPPHDEGAEHETRAGQWRAEGEATCARVYGEMYDKLRVNISELHPALDAWMVVEGYGKVLSRAGLDIVRRELCIVAVCAVAKQDRQLQSHLHGALNVGATPGQVVGTLGALDGLVDPDYLARALAMFTKVLGKQGE
ncbi:MAG: carboxymuconolactone decarboxylase family protein [Gemmatimonadaceae bacterium]